jgi:hypothetical protein
MKLIYSFLLLLTAFSTAFAQSDAISRKDFERIRGDWKGTLTYLDYSSGQPYTMPANISIARIGKTNRFLFTNSYPDEPRANSADTVTVSKNGKQLGDEVVKSRKVLSDGTVEIVTEQAGTDGNDDKAAIIRHTYSIGKTVFVIRKDVQFTGESAWINRHEYRYTR